MRQKMAILLAAVLVLGGAALIPGAHLLLTGREDAVTVEEEILYGDPEAAEGLQATLKTQCNVFFSQLLWDTTFAPDGTGKADTAFSFLRHLEPDLTPSPANNTITIDFCAANETFLTNAEDDENWWQRMEDADFLSLPARDVAGRTAAGEERTETVDLSDYYQLYSLCAAADLDMEGEVYYRTDLPWTELLTEFFRFPVLPGTTVEVTVRRSQSGPVEETRTSCGIAFPQILSGTADENTAYLFFDRANIAPSLDTSQITGGYGVYRLDYHRETVITEPEEGLVNMDDTLIFDGISTVLPVEGTVKEVLGSEDGESLLVFSEEDGMLWLSVLERGSDRLLQRLAVMPVTEEASYYHVNPLDGALLVRLWGGQTAVLEETGSGYRTALTADLSISALAPCFSPGSVTGFYWDCSAAAFDGERLAVLYSLPGDDDRALPDLGLAVVDRSGSLLLAARYRLSLSRANGEGLTPVCYRDASQSSYIWEENPAVLLTFS